VVGLALAVIFALMVYDMGDLTASVLSLSERKYIEQAERDAAYKKDDGNLEVFLSPKLQTYHQLFVSLLFSPTDIEILTPMMSSPYQWEVVNQSTDSLLLQVSGFADGNVDEGIVIVPFSGDMEDITVEFISDQLVGGTVFAVGNLTEASEDHL
jgi:hypothetical protein